MVTEYTKYHKSQKIKLITKREKVPTADKGFDLHQSSAGDKFTNSQ